MQTRPAADETVEYLVPCQRLLAAGAGPFHGGAPGDGVEAERLAFQADLRRRDSQVSACSVIELALRRTMLKLRSTWYVHF